MAKITTNGFTETTETAARVRESANLAAELQCRYTVLVKPLRFEWDTGKAAANLRKHGVSFAEAKTVFLDDEALLLPDDDHSSDEDRFIILGISAPCEYWLCAIATDKQPT